MKPLPSRQRRGARTVVFVGQRRRAFEAANALGLDVVCLVSTASTRRPPVGVRSLPCDFGAAAGELREIADRAAKRPVAAVFPLIEAAVLPAAHIRRHLGLAGDSPATAERATDKLEMKRAVTEAGIRCAPFADAGLGLDPGELIERLGLPLVIKDRLGSGGRGTRIVRRRDELAAPLAAGRIAESFVDGVEMSVESLVFKGRPAFVNVTEYFRVRWANILPAPLAPAALGEVLDLNARALAAIGVESASTHMELFLTSQGAVFSELATRPPGGHITDLIELAYGFDPWQAWLRLGLGEEPAAFPPAARAAGVWLLHPGAGVVKCIDGLEQARAMAGVERLRLRLRPAETVSERVGSGQEVGHILVTGRDRDQVAARLERARRCLRIEMEERAIPSA